jgi:chorismate lyase/3-hydroxybenzoate synthase
VRYVDAEDIGALDRGHLLATVCFADSVNAADDTGPLQISVGLPQLGARSLAEVWSSPRPVTSGVAGEIRFSCDGEALLGVITVQEDENLEEATRHAYDKLLAFTIDVDYSHLLRVWNSVPRINESAGQLERYRVFCRARSSAFEERYGARFEQRLCASSAVGSCGTELIVHFLAAREPGGHWENPRQVSAYHYPTHYGPRSPSFARATTAPAVLGAVLLVSGTASIVGFESRHGDDTLAQLDETLRNLRVVVDCAVPRSRRETVDLHGDPLLERLSILKIYLRDAADLATVSSRIDEWLGEDVPRVFLRADICRGELRIEIEAIAAGD